MTTAFLSLGSNIEPEKNILEAMKLLSRHVRILKVSTVYLTEPLFHKTQPKYYDCVIEIETDIQPHELKFQVLRAVEEQLGRRRTKDKYASRTIDIDILLYGEMRLKTKELIIPDPEIQKRAFLAIPLSEIEPKLLLPPTNKSIKEVAGEFKDYEMTPMRDFTEILQAFVRSLGV